jgi:RHS repeat-associated protein
MTARMLNQKPPLGPNFYDRPKSARERAASRWFSREKPSLPVRFASDKTLPGQYYDQETNLHYNYFRTYDPSIGRYITSDPIGLSGGFNTYIYTLQNPIIYTDIFGLTAVCPWRYEQIFFEGDKWVPYRGVSSVFHCGFTGFLENLDKRKCNDTTPEGECFYDERGNLVTIFHERSGCRGTPNYAPSTDAWEHIKQDVFPLPGVPALTESVINYFHQLIY